MLYYNIIRPSGRCRPVAVSPANMSNHNDALIRASGVSVRLGGNPILENVDIAIRPGEIVTIVGPNGSGKSTLLRTLIGAVTPSRGHVRIQPGLRIGYVPQRLLIVPTLPFTVRRFLNLPRRHSPAAIREALGRAGLGGHADAAMTSLSGGQFQRALMARAILDRPQLLMLDEASQGLDQTGTADFYRQVEEIRNALGCGVLMVSHDLHVVMRAADRVICLNHTICCQGHPEAVTADPQYHALFGTEAEAALALFRHDPHQHPHEPVDDEEKQSDAG